MNERKNEAAALLMQLHGLLHRQQIQFFRREGPFRSPGRGQGRVLAMLRMKPEMSQKELTFLLDMSKQAMAELLAKLEKSGYITREPAPDDHRAFLIKLTEKGAAAAADMEDDEAPDGMLRLFDGMSDEELEQLCGFFRRMLAQFGGEGGDWDARRRWFEEFARQGGPGERCGHMREEFARGERCGPHGPTGWAAAVWAAAARRAAGFPEGFPEGFARDCGCGQGGDHGDAPCGDHGDAPCGDQNEEGGAQ